MEQSFITRIVEAALLAAPQPLTLVQLNGLFPLDEPAPDGTIPQALTDLQTQCDTRGVELVEVASGWRYQVKEDVHPWVARLWTERTTKYTRATLETLALIAYRQPITRGEIEQIRGVAVNSNIIKALEEREWIRVVGHRDVPGKPELLGTTKSFLDYFGLKRLDELPPLSELKDFGELEPQLDLGDAIPVRAIAADSGFSDDTNDGAAQAANDAESSDTHTQGNSFTAAEDDAQPDVNQTGSTTDQALDVEDTTDNDSTDSELDDFAVADIAQADSTLVDDNALQEDFAEHSQIMDTETATADADVIDINMDRHDKDYTDTHLTTRTATQSGRAETVAEIGAQTLDTRDIPDRDAEHSASVESFQPDTTALADDGDSARSKT